LPSKLFVLAYDTHWPQTDTPTAHALLDFLEHVPVDGFTFGGDQFHFDCISHHTKGKGLYRLPGSYRREIETFDQQFLSQVEARLRPDAAKVWHIGNHERFEDDLIEEQPELQGIVDHTRILRLEERGWQVVPLGHCSRIGKLVVIHGEGLTGIGNQAGMYPSRKAVDLYGAPVVAGHTHAPQSFTKICAVEHTQKHMGWIAPILGRVNPTYLRNRPTAWLNGFVLVELMPNNNFNLYTIIVTKGKFSFAGHIYGGK
jgi:hypothetical protein